jgi:hypothetical protein
MGDIRSVRVLYLKAALFVMIGVLGVAGVLLECPTWRVAVLMALAVWGFCRAYYFAFYVVEHYADPGYRFAGLWDFAKYVLGKRAKRGQ